MGKLHDLGIKYGTDKATHHGYCDFYEQHLPKNITRLLEIGVKDGASLRMWRDYYPEAEIWGIDINEPIEVEGCKVMKRDATDPTIFHAYMPESFDVIIDDGSHMTKDQILAFKMLKWRVKDKGLYIVEDIHTSFIPDYINSITTAYDWFQDYAPIEFFRDPTNKTDSGTLIIQL